MSDPVKKAQKTLADFATGGLLSYEQSRKFCALMMKNYTWPFAYGAMPQGPVHRTVPDCSH